MKLLDKIMKLFGYENIENIHIYKCFKAHPPRHEKMWVRRLMYRYDGTLYADIILDENNYLIDGYTSYLVAKENNLKYVKVVR